MPHLTGFCSPEGAQESRNSSGRLVGTPLPECKHWEAQPSSQEQRSSPPFQSGCSLHLGPSHSVDPSFILSLESHFLVGTFALIERCPSISSGFPWGPSWAPNEADRPRSCSPAGLPGVASPTPSQATAQSRQLKRVPNPPPPPEISWERLATQSLLTPHTATNLPQFPTISGPTYLPLNSHQARPLHLVNPSGAWLYGSLRRLGGDGGARLRPWHSRRLRAGWSCPL